MPVSVSASLFIMLILASVMALTISHMEAFTDKQHAATCDMLTGFVDTLDGKNKVSAGSLSRNSHTPSNAWSQIVKNGKVIGGYSNGTNYHVCQGFSTTDGVLPGETWPGNDYCMIGNAGNLERASKFNFLDSKRNLFWSKYPAKKIVGGKQSGTDQHVCRGRVNQDMHIGRTWSGYDKCNVGLNGVETPLSDFEFLSDPSTITDKIIKMSTIDNVDNAGNDIANTKVSDAKACENLCRTTPACHVASYSKSSNQCWTKNDINPASLKQNSDITTFAKVMSPTSDKKKSFIDNTDYPGNDMASVMVPSRKMCGDLCEAIPKCNVAVWEGASNDSKPGNATCWLKASRSSPVNNVNRQSWVRN